MSPTLVVLAAGVGSRYGGLKQLAPVGPNGESLFEYSVFDGLRAGFDRLVLVVSEETEGELRRRVDSGIGDGMSVELVRQPVPAARSRPWGTAHAVLVADGVVDGPFAVINADDHYGTESLATLARFLAAPPEASLAMVGFRVDQTVSEAGPVSRAVCRCSEDGLLLAVEELDEVWRNDEGIVFRDASGRVEPLAPDTLVSMNMWGFTPDVFAELRAGFERFEGASSERERGEYLLPDAVQSWIRQDRFDVHVLRAGGDWFGITFREDEQRVGEMIRERIDGGHYPRELWG